MPYATRKVTGKPCYRVYNKKTKRVYAKCTSKTKAKKQIRLLRAIEGNPAFIPRKNLPKTRKNVKN